jgi:hypothetical protein
MTGGNTITGSGDSAYARIIGPGAFLFTPANAEQNKIIPQGDKSSYTSKQTRQAHHIEEGYKKRGVSPKEAKRRAWATENKVSGGGRKNGSGRGRRENHSPMRKGGRASHRSS